MNLILSFVHLKGSRAFGPLRAIRLDADCCRNAESGALLARYRDHQWEVEGKRYFRLDTAGKVRIQFERAAEERKSRLLGPFLRFSAIDGIAFADERVFAFVDPKVGDWFSYDDGHHWPVMVVIDAGESRSVDRLFALLAAAPALSGVFALWQGAKLLYLGHAASIRDGLRRAAESSGALRRGEVTAIAWETHRSPAEREAELRAEYESAARSLPATYGKLHGNLVRTYGLVRKARDAAVRARAAVALARRLREERRGLVAAAAAASG